MIISRISLLVNLSFLPSKTWRSCTCLQTRSSPEQRRSGLTDLRGGERIGCVVWLINMSELHQYVIQWCVCVSVCWSALSRTVHLKYTWCCKSDACVVSLTVGVTGSIGNEETGESKTGTGDTKKSVLNTKSINYDSKTRRELMYFFNLLVSPAQKSELPGTIFVHDDPHGQRDGWQQEGPHSEGQVQHLILVLADLPAVHLQVLFLWLCCGHVWAVEAGAVSCVVWNVRFLMSRDKKKNCFQTALCPHVAARRVVSKTHLLRISITSSGQQTFTSANRSLMFSTWRCRVIFTFIQHKQPDDVYSLLLLMLCKLV